MNFNDIDFKDTWKNPWKKKSRIQSDLNKASKVLEDDHYGLDEVKERLSKAIPMWLKYAAMKPEQSWMVIHLLKDALFVLDRYDEFEGLLKNVLELI